MARHAGRTPVLSGRPEKAQGARARRRHVGPGRRLRARQARLRLPDARSARSRRRTAAGRCAAAPSTPKSAASARSARSTKASTSTSARGASRHSHTGVLNYCRELGVPVQMFVNESDAIYFYYEGTAAGPLSNKRVRLREVKADMIGQTNELLVKAIDQQQARSAADRRGSAAARQLSSSRRAISMPTTQTYKAFENRGPRRSVRARRICCAPASAIGCARCRRSTAPPRRRCSSRSAAWIRFPKGFQRAIGTEAHHVQRRGAVGAPGRHRREGRLPRHQERQEDRSQPPTTSSSACRCRCSPAWTSTSRPR